MRQITVTVKLIFTMLNPDNYFSYILFWKQGTSKPDRLASEKTADQETHCFHTALKTCNANDWILATVVNE